ncbi:MAG: NfeD family protein [Eubacteriales bacterium]|nr:NfeD family protein [Eubacteriales bacterium]
MDVMTQVAAISFSGWAIACLVAGVVLVIVEMFTPGFGIPGITGLILLIVGIALAATSVVQAVAIAAVVVLVLLAAFVTMLILASKGKLERSPLVLKNRAEKAEGYVPSPVRQDLSGQAGVAVTPLRPAGIGMFGEQRVDVVTRGEFIPRETPIEVIETAGNTVVVAAVQNHI